MLTRPADHSSPRRAESDMAMHKNENARDAGLRNGGLAASESDPSRDAPGGASGAESGAPAPHDEAHSHGPSQAAHEHAPPHEAPGSKVKAKAAGDAKRVKNRVREIRLERMMSKAELARRAAVSTLTIDRIERGLPCRMDTK